MSDDAQRWDQRYAEGADRWTLDAAPAVLEQVIAAYAEPLRVLVPGAGVGTDAFAWARHRHVVTALDFAPRAIATMRARAQELGLALETIEVDVTAPPVGLRGRIDLVWEQTCLCALPPEQRRPYLEAMATILRPQGEMVALLWNHGEAEGPPYDMAPAVVEEMVAGVFAIVRRERVDDSLSTRSNQYLWRLRPVRL